jgi:NAD(P) transhydrogenase
MCKAMTTDGPFDYDLLVIGSGPGGQKAAVQAAKLDKRVGIVERRAEVGGVCINTGTIPSKTLREAVLYLSGYRERGFYGAAYTVKAMITPSDLLSRCDAVMRQERDVILHQLRRNGVELIGAAAHFAGPHRVHLQYNDGRGEREVTAGYVVIATGTVPRPPPGVELDDHSVLDSDGILRVTRIPRSGVIIGAGVIGCEYASILAVLGTRVTLIDTREHLLPFVDREIAHALEYRLRSDRVSIRLGETVELVEHTEDGGVRVYTASGKQIHADAVMYCAGRQGATAELCLDTVGLQAVNRGLLEVNEHCQTEVPYVYAVGDVIGFPSLASASMQQGRVAARHAFGMPVPDRPDHFPYGIYTIPEISMVGASEEELTASGVPYEVGKAHYREIARGQILGDQSGMLKLLFHLHTHELLGVHIIGEGAAELIHVGQAVLTFGGTVDYFAEAVFNYPTLAETYKVAALDGLNRL